MANNAAQIVITAKDETQAAIRSVTNALGTLESKAIALGPLFGAMAAALSVGSFKGAIEGAIAFSSRLDDMAESTGATVENLSALASVAKIGGHDLGAVEGSLVKLSKALHSTDDESKGAAKALAAIGLSVDDLKSKDPADAMLDIAKALEKFKDGSGKTAAVLAILGKSGAEMMPFLKDLAETGKLVGKITAEQAAQAELYEKNMKRLEAQFGRLQKAAARELIPALTDITEWMMKGTEKGGIFLGILTGVGAAMAAASGQEINESKIAQKNADDAFKRLTGLKSDLAIWQKTLEDGKGIDGFLGGGRAKAKIADLTKEIAAAEKVLASATKRQKDLAGDRDANRFKKADVDYTAANPKKEGVDKQKQAYDSLIESLREKTAVEEAQLSSVNKLTAADKDYAKFQADLASGALVLSNNQRMVAEAYFETYRARAKDLEMKKSKDEAKNLIDDAKRANALTVERIARQADLNRMSERERQIAESAYKVEDDFAKLRERIIDKVKDETAQKIALADAEAMLADQKGRVTEATAKAYDDQRSFEYGWIKTFQRYQDDASNAAKRAEEVFTRATDGMTDALTEFAMTGKLSFSNLAQSIIADLIRIQIRAQVSGVMSYLSPMFAGVFGAAKPATGGPSGTIDSMGMWANGGAFSGGVQAFANGGAFTNSILSSPTLFKFANGGKLGVMGEAGPEAIMPLKRDASGRLGVSAQGSGAPTVNVVVNNTVSDQADVKVQHRMNDGVPQIELIVSRVVASDLRTNGPMTQGFASTFGLSRNI